MTMEFINNTKKCFVIMPFSDDPKRPNGYWTNFFNDFIQPAFKPYGYCAFRSEATPQNITKNIIQSLAYSDLVLAVLTDNNPNVWYELGVRHSLRQGTIMMLEEGNKIPFDVHDYGVIYYDDSKIDEFIESLKKYLPVADQEWQDSPVTDFLNNLLPQAVNIAISRLKESVDYIKKNYHGDKKPILQKLREIQESWNNRGQISIIENNAIVLHEDSNLLGQDANERWKDITKTSFYDRIVASRDGLRITQLNDRPDRLTVFAFKTLVRPKWILIAEAHYYYQATSLW